MICRNEHVYLMFERIYVECRFVFFVVENIDFLGVYTTNEKKMRAVLMAN